MHVDRAIDPQNPIYELADCLFQAECLVEEGWPKDRTARQDLWSDKWEPLRKRTAIVLSVCSKACPAEDECFVQAAALVVAMSDRNLSDLRRSELSDRSEMARLLLLDHAHLIEKVIDEGRPKKRIRKGPGQRADSERIRADSKIAEAWHSGQHKTKKDLARELTKPLKEVNAALERHRKRSPE